MKLSAKKKLPTAKWRALAESIKPAQVFLLRSKPKPVWCLRFDCNGETVDIHLSEHELWSIIEKSTIKIMTVSGEGFRRLA